VSDQAAKPDPPDLTVSRSTVFEKLSPVFRLDQALIDRQPPAYRAVYDQFDLGAHGISYTAFYNYARRVRTQSAILELAQHVSPDAPQSHEILPEILSQRLLGAALDEETSPRTLQRLADAYRIASATLFARRRLAAQLDDAKHNARNREADDLCPTARQIAQLRHAEFLQGGPGAFRHFGEPVPAAEESPIAANQPEGPARVNGEYSPAT
jgi:hypothetical protein